MRSLFGLLFLTLFSCSQIGPVGYTTLIDFVEGVSQCSNGGFTILSGIDVNRNLVLDSGEVLKSRDICNGMDAPPTTYTPVDLVNPCGDAPSLIDEILIRLTNGDVVASLSDKSGGSNTRFVVLEPGDYTTTDGDSCEFSLDSDGVIYNESHSY